MCVRHYCMYIIIFYYTQYHVHIGGQDVLFSNKTHSSTRHTAHSFFVTTFEDISILLLLLYHHHCNNCMIYIDLRFSYNIIACLLYFVSVGTYTYRAYTANCWPLYCYRLSEYIVKTLSHINIILKDGPKYN